MKTLEQFIPQELTQAIGFTILHSLWQGVVIALGLTVILWALHRESAITRYRIALGALFLQLLTSAITFWYSYQSAEMASQALANANFKATVFLNAAVNQPTFSWQ